MAERGETIRLETPAAKSTVFWLLDDWLKRRYLDLYEKDTCSFDEWIDDSGWRVTHIDVRLNDGRTVRHDVEWLPAAE